MGRVHDGWDRATARHEDAGNKDELRRGQVRQLRARSDTPGTHTSLALLASDAREDWMDEDICTQAGACRTVHALLLTDARHGTAHDLIVPASISGHGRDMCLLLDTLGAIRLEAGIGPDRFGPVVTHLPDAAVSLAWAILCGHWTRVQDAARELEKGSSEWRLGTRDCQPDSEEWGWRTRQAGNWRRLAGWL